MPASGWKLTSNKILLFRTVCTVWIQKRKPRYSCGFLFFYPRWSWESSCKLPSVSDYTAIEGNQRAVTQSHWQESFHGMWKRGYKRISVKGYYGKEKPNTSGLNSFQSLGWPKHRLFELLSTIGKTQTQLVRLVLYCWSCSNIACTRASQLLEGLEHRLFDSFSTVGRTRTSPVR